MMFRSKKGFTLIELFIGICIVGIIAAIALGSCRNSYGMGSNPPDADKIQAQQTRDSMAEANRQIGMPNIVNFQQKKLLRMIQELCDKENLICYAYIKSDYQGKLVYIGQCIGFGIPFSAQYTNPERPAHVNGFIREYSLPQADPNGLFMPTSSSATWLIMIDPKTKEPRPVYLEPEIVVSPFPLHDMK